MKISSLENKASVSALTGDGKPARGVSSKERTVKSEDSAKVAISAEGQQLAEAAADPTFDAAKVDRIAQSIRNGQFQVNPDKIADKLISNARDLLQRYQSH